MPAIDSATNDIDSSVMIDDVKEFHSSHLHGAIVKMNHDGVDMVGGIITLLVLIKTNKHLTPWSLQDSTRIFEPY